MLTAPAGLCLAAAAALGPERGSGRVLVAVAGLYLVAAVAVLPSWLRRVLGGRRLRLGHIAHRFRTDAMACASAAELAQLLSQTNRRLANTDRALLIVHADEAPLEIYGGSASDDDVVRTSEALIADLMAQPALVYADDDALDDDVAALLQTLGCHLALPLRHGDRPLGLALLGVWPRRFGRSFDPLVTFWPFAHVWLRTALSLALTRQGLGFDLAHRLALKSSLDYARATQEALMPAETPFHSDGFLIHGMFRPAAQCGGDLWLWRRLGPGCLLVVLGDVTGHGVAPAMLSAAAAGVIQIRAIAAGVALDPAELLHAIGASIHQVARGRYMMTAFVAIFDLEAGVVRYANAAQTFPVVVRPYATGGGPAVEIKTLRAPGPMLGGSSESLVENHEQAIAPGSRVVLFTDGIVEAERAPGQAYGERRLRQTLNALAHGPADRVASRVLSDVHKFLDNAAAEDDMTVVVVEWPKAEEAG